MEKVKKRSRPNHFSTHEIDLLTNLLVKYQDKIENFGGNTTSWRKRMECWYEITTKFNALSNAPARTTASLRNKYDSLKKDIKKKVTDSWEITGIRGGLSKVANLTASEEKIFNIIKLSTENLQSKCDESTFNTYL